MKVKFNKPITRQGGDLFLRRPITFAAEETEEKRKLLGTQAFEDMPGDWPYINPDNLVGTKGLTLFSKMLREDEMLFSSSCYLSLATISPGVEIEAGEATNEAERAAQFQRDQFERMQGSLTQVMLDILDGAFRGFSVLEPEWEDKDTKGDWKGKQRYRALRSKNPAYIQFKVDSYGAVEDNGVWQLDYTGSAGQGQYRKVDLEEVIYYAFWPRDDNPYGSPLLRPAYPYYFAKSFGLKQWWAFLEKFGHPLIMGRVDDTTDVTERTQYLAMLQKFWKNLVSVVSGDIDIEMHQPDYKSTDQFEAMLRFCNRAEARSLLLPALVMEHDGSIGSLAMAKEQGSDGQFLWILRHFARALEQVVNDQVIHRSHVLNFGDRIPQPKLKILDYVKEDLAIRAQVYGSLSLIGMPFSVPELRREFSIPEGETGDLQIGGRPAGGGPLNEEGMPLPKPKPITVDEEGEAKAGSSVPGLPPGTPPEKVEEVKAEMTRKAFDMRREPMKGTTYSFAAPASRIDDHVDYEKTNREEDISAEWWGQIGAVVFEDMAEAVERQEGKGNGTPPSR